MGTGFEHQNRRQLVWRQLSCGVLGQPAVGPHLTLVVYHIPLQGMLVLVSMLDICVGTSHSRVVAATTFAATECVERATKPNGYPRGSRSRICSIRYR